MEYVIFAGSALLLAWSLPYWESHQTRSSSGSRFVPRLAGVLGHLGGALALGWLAAPTVGFAAFVAIPLVASVIHGLLIGPRRRARRLRGGEPRRPQTGRESPQVHLSRVDGVGARAR
jgi:uncharacterized membrane protein YdcZ (DUF606 family)